MNKNLIGNWLHWEIPANKTFENPVHEYIGEVIDKVRIHGGKTAYLVVTSIGEVHVVEPYKIKKVK